MLFSFYLLLEVVSIWLKMGLRLSQAHPLPVGYCYLRVCFILDIPNKSCAHSFEDLTRTFIMIYKKLFQNQKVIMLV